MDKSNAILTCISCEGECDPSLQRALCQKCLISFLCDPKMTFELDDEERIPDHKRFQNLKKRYSILISEEQWDGGDLLKSFLQSSSHLFVLSKIKDFVQVVERNDSAKDFLFQIIEKSKLKKDPVVAKRSSNAITLLNLARVSFAKCNFEGAQFEGARLQHADFQGANLRNANLKDAILRRTNLTNANLKGAILTGASFGLDGIFNVKDGVICVDYSPNSKMVIAGCTNGRIFLLTNDKCSSIPAHADDVNCLSFSPDGKYFASGGKDRTIKLWSVSQKKSLKIFKVHDGPVWGLSFSPNGKYLASCGNDGNVNILDIQTESIRGTLKDHLGPVYAVKYSPDGRFIATSGADKLIKVWESRKDYCLTTITSKSNVNQVVIDPEGKNIIAGMASGNINIYDLDSGEQKHVLKGHDGEIYGLRISPDGKYIASVGQDATVRIWSFATQICLKTFTGSDDATSAVCFSCDSNKVAFSCFDGTVRVLNLSEYELFEEWYTGNHEASILPLKLTDADLDGACLYQYQIDSLKKKKFNGKPKAVKG